MWRLVGMPVVALLAVSCSSSRPSSDGVDGGTLEVDAGSEVADMALVPAGDFVRGCNEAFDNECILDELPTRTINLSAYYIDLYEVSQVKYQACMDDGGCSEPALEDDYAPENSPELPTTGVLWEQARTYCLWAGKRLPTEAEWEKAARGTDGRVYPWGNEDIDCLKANASGCLFGLQGVATHAAGESPYGARNMVGNASEWVADWYDYDAYLTAASIDPSGPSESPDGRVVRGGHRNQGRFHLRASSRNVFPAQQASLLRGFRCAADME